MRMSRAVAASARVCSRALWSTSRAGTLHTRRVILDIRIALMRTQIRGADCRTQRQCRDWDWDWERERTQIGRERRVGAAPALVQDGERELQVGHRAQHRVELLQEARGEQRVGEHGAHGEHRVERHAGHALGGLRARRVNGEAAGKLLRKETGNGWTKRN